MLTYRLFYVHDDSDNYTGYLVSILYGKVSEIMRVDNPVEVLSETIRYARTVVTYSELLDIIANGVGSY